MLIAFFAPLLFLPGRVYPAYTYLPLTGAAVELATLASLAPPVATLAFFAMWIPWNILELRHDRKATLTADDEVRIYAGALMDFAREHPDAPALSFSSVPATFHMWGIRAALNYPNPGKHIAAKFVDEKAARALPPDARVTFINWNRDRNTVDLLIKDPAAPGASYLKMGPAMPIWQLDDGWYGLDDSFRWTEPHAKAHLYWPAGGNRFEMVVNVSAVMIQKYGYTAIRLRINGKDFGSIRFDQPGIETRRWELPPRDSPEARVEFEFEPAGHFPPDPRLLGAPVVAFGFVPARDGA
jgi:hypothetical protein